MNKEQAITSNVNKESLLQARIREFRLVVAKEYPEYKEEFGYLHIYRKDSGDFIQFFPMLGFAGRYIGCYKEEYTLIYDIGAL